MSRCLISLCTHYPTSVCITNVYSQSFVRGPCVPGRRVFALIVFASQIHLSVTVFRYDIILNLKSYFENDFSCLNNNNNEL